MMELTDEDDNVPEQNFDDNEMAETPAPATHRPEKAVSNPQRPSTLISLGAYNDADMLTKKEMCSVLRCSPRTLQRMMERFEVPPPIWLGGRKVWIVGNVRTWIDDIAKRHEKEAARVARKMRIFLD